MLTLDTHVTDFFQCNQCMKAQASLAPNLVSLTFQVVAFKTSNLSNPGSPTLSKPWFLTGEMGMLTDDLPIPQDGCEDLIG